MQTATSMRECSLMIKKRDMVSSLIQMENFTKECSLKAFIMVKVDKSGPMVTGTKVSGILGNDTVEALTINLTGLPIWGNGHWMNELARESKHTLTAAFIKEIGCLT